MHSSSSDKLIKNKNKSNIYNTVEYKEFNNNFQENTISNINNNYFDNYDRNINVKKKNIINIIIIHLIVALIYSKKELI